MNKYGLHVSPSVYCCSVIIYTCTFYIALHREAQLEEQDYESAVRYNAEMTARERAERESKHAASLQHRDAILTQVQDLEQARRTSRNAKFEEGRILKQAAALERAKLEAMRDRMVSLSLSI